MVKTEDFFVKNSTADLLSACRAFPPLRKLLKRDSKYIQKDLFNTFVELCHPKESSMLLAAWNTDLTGNAVIYHLVKLHNYSIINVSSIDVVPDTVVGVFIPESRDKRFLCFYVFGVAVTKWCGRRAVPSCITHKTFTANGLLLTNPTYQR